MQDTKTNSTSNNPKFDKELQHAFLKFVEATEDGSFELCEEEGICGNFWAYCSNEICGKAHDFLKQIFPLWDKFSGDLFPINGGDQMYFSSSAAGTLWDKSQEYGKLRWELLYFIRDYCYTQITNKGEVR